MYLKTLKSVCFIALFIAVFGCATEERFAPPYQKYPKTINNTTWKAMYDCPKMNGKMDYLGGKIFYVGGTFNYPDGGESSEFKTDDFSNEEFICRRVKIPFELENSIIFVPRNISRVGEYEYLGHKAFIERDVSARASDSKIPPPNRVYIRIPVSSDNNDENYILVMQENIGAVVIDGIRTKSTVWLRGEGEEIIKHQRMINAGTCTYVRGEALFSDVKFGIKRKTENWWSPYEPK